jgi:hypothetical protein
MLAVGRLSMLRQFSVLLSLRSASFSRGGATLCSWCCWRIRLQVLRSMLAGNRRRGRARRLQSGCGLLRRSDCWRFA